MLLFSCFVLRRWLRAGALALSVGCLVSPLAAAPVVLHSFAPLDQQGHNADGAYLYSGLTEASNGDWYGTTENGGAGSAGTVFKMHADGSGFTVLKNFASGSPTDGGYPAGPMEKGIDGYMYGTTDHGGITGAGTVFRVGSDGQFHSLHTFTPVGPDPDSGATVNVFQASDGLLYGGYNDTSDSANRIGFLFRMNADGTGYQTFHPFAATKSDGTNVGGAPNVLLSGEGSDGLLYGVTLLGGAHGAGVVFQIAKSGTGFAVLHDFDAAPVGSLLPGPSANMRKGLDGAFYGLTYQGGANDTGSIFRIDTSGNFKTLASFPALPANGLNTAGANPFDGKGMTQGPDGTLYGVTYAGGAAGAGTVFAISPDGSGLRSLLDFHASDVNHPADEDDNGVRFHVTFGSNGLLYVTTDGGGTNGTGAVLAFAPPQHTHLLWNNTNGQASLWNYEPFSGVFTSHAYGPYTGWTAKALADGPDAKTRFLWNNTNGQMSLWNLDNSTGAYTQHSFGPFAGWTANAVSVTPSNVTHILWTNTNGTASVWNYSTANGTYTQKSYGPFAGWKAISLADGPDGKVRLLWVKTNGVASVWSLDNGTGSYTQFSFGPISGWSAKSVSVGADNTTHILWTNVNGSASVWNENTATGAYTSHIFGPFSGWSAVGLSDGPDGQVRLLWDNSDGHASLWRLSSGSGTYTQHTFGPFAGWTATAVSAGP